MRKRPAHRVTEAEADASIFKMNTRRNYGQDTERKIVLAQKKVAAGVPAHVACSAVFGFENEHLVQRIKSQDNQCENRQNGNNG
jgi:hypothetical protein